MPRRSAGLLPFRIAPDGCSTSSWSTPGGPSGPGRTWGRGPWPKASTARTKRRRVAAEREFAEEVGVPAPPGPRIDLGQVEQASGKVVRVWAVDAPAIRDRPGGQQPLRHGVASEVGSAPVLPGGGPGRMDVGRHRQGETDAAQVALSTGCSTDSAKIGMAPLEGS